MYIYVYKIRYSTLYVRIDYSVNTTSTTYTYIVVHYSPVQTIYCAFACDKYTVAKLTCDLFSISITIIPVRSYIMRQSNKCSPAYIHGYSASLKFYYSDDSTGLNFNFKFYKIFPLMTCYKCITTVIGNY